jgi:hypothetical protein
MFGIQPYAGRLLNTDDDRTGAPRVAVISYRLWEQTYGSDPSVIGSVFNFDNKPFTVVGITPLGFFGDTLRENPPDFYLQLATDDTIRSRANSPSTGTNRDILSSSPDRDLFAPEPQGQPG